MWRDRISLELWNTFASFGTFIVIAATAVAALVQLRHAPGGNQIAALQDLADQAATHKFIAAEQLVMSNLAEKLADPEFRYFVATRCATTAENQAMRTAARDVGNHYENIGLLVRTGLVDRELALNLWSATAKGAWDLLAEYTAIARQRGGNAIWENFEFYVVLSQDWLAAHPNGAYPEGARRISLKSRYAEADMHYATSRTPAGLVKGIQTQ